MGVHGPLAEKHARTVERRLESPLDGRISCWNRLCTSKSPSFGALAFSHSFLMTARGSFTDAGSISLSLRRRAAALLVVDNGTMHEALWVMDGAIFSNPGGETANPGVYCTGKARRRRVMKERKGRPFFLLSTAKL